MIYLHSARTWLSELSLQLVFAYFYMEMLRFMHKMNGEIKKINRSICIGQQQQRVQKQLNAHDQLRYILRYCMRRFFYVLIKNYAYKLYKYSDNFAFLIQTVLFFPSRPQTELCCCAACGEPISDRYLLEVGGCTWHGSCLRCCICLSPLDRQPSCFLRERQVYCKTDYAK